MAPFVPGSLYAKRPNAVEFKMPATRQKSVPGRNKTGVQVQIEVKARQEITKRIFPGNPLIDLDPQHVVGGGQEVQEVICQCRELEKTARIQKGTDCKDTSENSLTVMMMMALSQRLANRWKK